MPASNPIDILLDHNHWATRQLFLACMPLRAANDEKIF
jgi:hypothetical protein